MINDLTFRKPQHTSSEVTAGYNTIRFKCLREKDWNLIMTLVKKKTDMENVGRKKLFLY